MRKKNHRRRSVSRIGSFLCLAILAATAGWAEEETPSSVILESPDYSKEALLELLRTEEVEADLYEDRIELRWQDWVVRFLPLVRPLTINDGSYGSAQIHEPVNGLALLGVDYPLTTPAGDEIAPLDASWRERMFRRRMIGEINRANRRDNR